MNNKETRKRMNEIIADREVLFQELQEIRKDCSHDSYRIGNWSWRPGVINVAQICNHCDNYLGTPSEEEDKLFDNPFISPNNFTLEIPKDDKK